MSISTPNHRTPATAATTNSVSTLWPIGSPTTAWRTLLEGNRRVVAGEQANPAQGADDRAQNVGKPGQPPTAVIFGCTDARVAAEFVFDSTLGELCVVRTAGHVVSSSVLASIEYAVEHLDVPLVVVLGHDDCGAVRAACAAVDRGAFPEGYFGEITGHIALSVLRARDRGATNIEAIEGHHVVETAGMIADRSDIIGRRIESGRLAIVSLTYALTDGAVTVQDVIGPVAAI